MGQRILAFMLAISFFQISVLLGDDTKTIQGRWMADYYGKNQSVHLNLKRGGSNNGFTIPLRELAGLTEQQILSSSTRVNFRLPREAGDILLDGEFRNGKGTGYFEFQPNPEFPKKMAQAGYPNVPANQIYEMAVLNVSTNYIQELRTLGYSGLPLDDVIEMKIHGVSPEFIKELADLEYKQIPTKKLIEMRIHGVSLRMIKDLKELGYENITVGDLIEMRIFGVDAAFIKRVRSEGHKDPSVKQLINMKIHGR